MKIPILKQTRHLIIINKPALVYSQHNSSQSSQSSLSSQQELPLLNLLRESSPDLFPKSVQAPFTWPKLVHRLDYGVSGAMVVATSMQVRLLPEERFYTSAVDVVEVNAFLGSEKLLKEFEGRWYERMAITKDCMYSMRKFDTVLKRS